MRVAIKIALAIQLLFFSPAAPAVAQDPTLPGLQTGPNREIQKLIEELSARIDEAERARQADPWFLRDLRTLLKRYDYPWQVRLISEDFRDGDYTKNPSWTVTKGEFSVSWGGGLATSVRPRTGVSSPSSQSGQTGSPSPGDVAIAILGELLKERSGASESRGREASAPEQVSESAEIYLPQRITQAFAITAVVSGRPTDAKADGGGLELGVYDGNDRQAGYRLLAVPRESMTLLRNNSRGSSVIEMATRDAALSDGKDHVIEWTRTRDGQMAVRLDGTQIMATTDRSLRQDFLGFHLINRGGDYLLRSLTINGTK